MKNYIYLLLFAAMFAASCNKSKLDLRNPNTLTTADFWKTQDDAIKGVNAIYAVFYESGSWARWMYFRTDLTSDEGFSNSPWVELADWTKFNYINYNFWEGNVSSWQNTFKAIFRANQVIQKVPELNFDNTRKQQIIGEAKFLRAFQYYYAILLWENVPIVLEPDDKNPGITRGANTPEETWAQIEKDLKDAIAVLPEQWDAANVGRPTKGAAYALLGKSLLQQKKWGPAKDAFDYLVTGAGKNYYDLVDYKENFRATQENNKESVFEIQFSNVNKGGDGDVINNNMGTHRGQFFAPRGIGWSDGQARYWLVQEFKKEKTADGKIDPRLQYSLFYKESFDDFGVKTYGRDWAWGATEAWFKKYSRDNYRNDEDYNNEVNNRIIRYADVLLMYAEALNELGQTADAYQYVNKVRTRSNMRPLATAYPAIGNDKNAFRNRLKMERALELCGESVRWADLKRWGDLDTQAGVDAVKQRDPDFNNFKVGKHIRLPIPQVEIEVNQPLYQQNPNY